MINFIVSQYKKIGVALERLRVEAPLFYSAVKTGAAAFGAMFLPVLVTFVTDLYLWADTGEGFPAMDTLLRTLFAAFIGGLAAVINFIWNLRENSVPPVYTPKGE